MRIFITEHMDAARLNRRRFVFFSSVFVLTSLATWVVADLYWRGTEGLTGLELILLLLFVPLFAHIAVGFCTALAGFYVINRGGDGSRISVSAPEGGPYRLASTAIVMPVFNEDVSRVFEGLRVVFGSVQKIPGAENFDFFVLSDSNQPNQWIREEVAWAELCKQVGGFGKIFYRKRRQAINKKAGNVADFLRRWGKNYRYMVVLDADSIMTGECLARLVTMMEANPSAGIIQTAPRTVRGESLYSRLQAFANRLYSPLFLAGLNYWQQHEGEHWGPQRDHPGAALHGGPLLASRPAGQRALRRPDPLSHDFVEAALMRKAGWAVWLAHDVEGELRGGAPDADRGRRKARPALVPGKHAARLASSPPAASGPQTGFTPPHGGDGLTCRPLCGSPCSSS